MKTVNVENIEKRIAWINSTIKNDSLTKYMLPIQLKELRFERDCLCKLRELMENKPNSQNPVDADVQALIEHCKLRIKVLQNYWHINEKDMRLAKLDLRAYESTLAALTAEPALWSYWFNDETHYQEARFGKPQLKNGKHLRETYYTNPPAQLLRPVELPESFYGVVQSGKAVMLPADDGQWLNKTAVIEALRQHGYEVKND